MLVDAVIARINGQVPVLSGRTEGAASFADLMRQNALPQVTPAAHVLPLGLQGGAADAGSDIFRQAFDEVVAVVLTYRSHDRTGGRAVGEIDGIIRQLIEAIVGWGPDEAIGVFRLARAALISMSAGTIVYQIEFAITDQLRIAT